MRHGHHIHRNNLLNAALLSEIVLVGFGVLVIAVVLLVFSQIAQ
jgi:hypothetical protein